MITADTLKNKYLQICRIPHDIGSVKGHTCKIEVLVEKEFIQATLSRYKTLKII